MRRAKFKANSSPQKRFLGCLADAVCLINTASSLLIKDLAAENKALRQELAPKKRPERKYAEEGDGNKQEFAEGQERHEENLKRLRAERAKEKRREERVIKRYKRSKNCSSASPCQKHR